MARDKDAIRAEILDRFRQMNAGRNYALTLRWLQQEYLPGLSAEERRAYDAACEDLAREGLVKTARSPRGDTISITRKGVEAIYPPADPERIKREVLAKFVASGARDGYVLPEYWLQREYEPSLNELQQEIYQDTLQEMAMEGLVQYVARPVPNLKVTAKGLEIAADQGEEVRD